MECGSLPLLMCRDHITSVRNTGSNLDAGHQRIFLPTQLQVATLNSFVFCLRHQIRIIKASHTTVLCVCAIYVPCIILYLLITMLSEITVPGD